MSGLGYNIEDIIEEISPTEFGVGFGDPDQPFYAVPVDESVQPALRVMISDTWKAMQECSEGPERYEPSEKYSVTEHIFLPTNDVMVRRLRNLHEAKNLPIGTKVLRKEFNAVSCYFTRITDRSGRRLTAVRRATQFKGVLKSKLVTISDCMELVKDNVFKLDKDFDLLIDSENIHILHPSGLENICKLQDEILRSVPKNIETLQKDLSFVNFETIKEYAMRHARCARSLSAICSQEHMKNIDKDALVKHCKKTGVEITYSNGKIVVGGGDKNIVGFLEVLDRRRYTTELKQGDVERFSAPSRRRINT